MTKTNARVLFAFSETTTDASLLEFGWHLAEMLDAEFCGLFVEDINLINLAGLPFARELNVVLSTDTPLNNDDVELLLRMAAARVQRMIAEMGRSGRVAWSFEVLRGQLSPTLLGRARHDDLLILTPPQTAGRPPDRTTGLRFASLVSNAPCSVLLARPAAQGCGAVWCVYDDPRFDMRSINVAARIAAQTDKPLKVLITRGASIDRNAVIRDLQTTLPDPDRIELISLRAATPLHWLKHHAGDEPCLFVFDVRTPQVHGEDLAQWLFTVNAPTLVTRGESS